MKIRQGFVSNSSTSSFCIYGTILDSDEIIENLKAEYKAMFALSDDDEDELEPYEIFEKFLTMRTFHIIILMVVIILVKNGHL